MEQAFSRTELLLGPAAMERLAAAGWRCLDWAV